MKDIYDWWVFYKEDKDKFEATMAKYPISRKEDLPKHWHDVRLFVGTNEDVMAYIFKLNNRIEGVYVYKYIKLKGGLQGWIFYKDGVCKGVGSFNELSKILKGEVK